MTQIVVNGGILDLIIDDCPCATMLNRENNEPCVTTIFIESMLDLIEEECPTCLLDLIESIDEVSSKEMLNSKELTSDDKLKIVNETKKILNVSTEKEILSNNIFIRFAKKHEIGDSKLNMAKELLFKPEGPRNTLDWLSNKHIDDVLTQWSMEFTDFYHCPFAMIDFESVNWKFGKINLPSVMSGNEPLVLGEYFNDIFIYHL